MKDIKEIIKEELVKIGVDIDSVVLSAPKDLKNGDYSFFVKDKAIKVAELPLETLTKNKYIKSAQAVGQFINIYLSDAFFAELLQDVLSSADNFGKNTLR